MQSGQGVFIAIEGSDGSGKQTQFDLLTQQLAGAGYDVAVFDFPQYQQPSSYFVREYLSGKYGGADQVGPYTASLFYALDRYHVASQIRQALAAGKVVLANRFVGSSMAHQGTKFYHAEERRGYFIWLDNLEFEMLRIPRPTMSFVLRVPAETARQLMAHKTHDIHEADIEHLKKAVEVYDDMCQLFPKDFTKIDCMKGAKLQSVSEVQRLLWQYVQPLLPPAPTGKQGSVTTVTTPPATQAAAAPAPASPAPAEAAPAPAASGYYVPDTLTGQLRADYCARIDKILALYTDMVEKLSAHLATDKQDMAARTRAYETLRAVLPVAVAPLAELGKTPAATTAPSAVATLAAEHLADTYGQPVDPVQLVEVWPRNELDSVADALYPHTSMPLASLRSTTQAWPYAQKVQVLEAAIAQHPAAAADSALQKVRYGWDIVSDYSVFYDVRQQGILHHSTWQPLTPRYGYDVPAIIEAAGLTDAFETCFELSLHLHSSLQAAGHIHEAQYVTLYGHRMRWQVQYSAAKAIELYQQLAYPVHPAYRQLLATMHEKLSVVHPIIAEALRSDAS